MRSGDNRWVCLKIGYIPNYSHLVGIIIINHWVIGYTIFRQTQISRDFPYKSRHLLVLILGFPSRDLIISPRGFWHVGMFWAWRWHGDWFFSICYIYINIYIYIYIVPEGFWVHDMAHFLLSTYHALPMSSGASAIVGSTWRLYMSIFGSINMLGAFSMNNRSQFPCEPEPFLLRRKTRFSRGRTGFLYMCSSCSLSSIPVPKPFHT